MSFYPQLVLDTLKHVVHPGKGQDIVTLGMVEDDIRIEGKRISFSLLFDRTNDPLVAPIKKACVQAIETYIGDGVEIKGNIYVKVKPRQLKKEEPILTGVKNVVAIASGKGGVGKSTVASNLAVALALQGYKVGLLDADIFGPSMPKMFGTEEARPMLEKVAGAVVVSTPQEVALADARKGISMFQGKQIDVPVLGLVENMAWFTPAELPDNKYYIFGEGGCKRLAETLNVPLLGQIPIVQSIREGGDDGLPSALNPDTLTGMAFAQLAEAVVEAVELRNSQLPPTKIVQITKK
ncbi:MAG: Mrp/NBP35 family ATP-binding protein [Bacteroidales bacterium]|nr:Mrp/NBP35 family ATP-binding protein [Bacteroidales bacterium]